nr:lysophospholipid acyltransferase family protein [bacterium]
MKNSFYAFVRWLSHILFIYHGMRLEGEENIPKEGPVVLIVNHRIWFDVVCVAHSTPRQVFFISKSENFQNKFFGWFLKKLDVIPVHRGESDMQAIRKGLQVLGRGDVLCVFPEGTRNRTKEVIQEFHNGAALFALTSGAPCIPIFLGEFAPFRRTRVRVGKPVDLSPWRGGRVNSTAMDGATEKLRQTMLEMAKNG